MKRSTLIPFLLLVLLVALAGCKEKRTFSLEASHQVDNLNPVSNVSITIGDKTDDYEVKGLRQWGVTLKEGEPFSATMTCVEGCDSTGKIILLLLSNLELPGGLRMEASLADTQSIMINYTWLP